MIDQPGLVLVGTMLAAGVLLGAYGCARAAESSKSPPTHQLYVCPRGWGYCITSPPQGQTACLLDAASERLARGLPAGSRIECRRVR